ncbi:MAG TPA: amidohydrolase family protein [Candidatus Krumholzibacteria bacterium]|nr:amidohydrolase family protein [Candidatus Krumholzibacteria bacterium]
MSRMTRLISLIALSLVAIAPVLVHAQALVIDGGTIHSMKGDPFVGRVVIERGVITAVGADAAVPAGATRIDASGLHVYPGLFDAMSSVGLDEVDAVSATNDMSEMGMYNPNLSTATAVHPASEVIPVTRVSGITHSLVVPGTDRDGVIAGQAAIVNLDGWTETEMAVNNSAALVIEWPGIVTRRFDFTTFTVKETPYSDAKDEATKKQNELRDWIDAAKHYGAAVKAKGSRADINPKLAALSQYVDGTRPVIIEADRKADIEAAIAFADEMGLRMILAGGRDAWKVKDTLVAKKIPVILGRTQSLPTEDDDPYDKPYANPGDLCKAGIKIAFASGAGGGFGPDGPHGARTLPYEAGQAAAFGLSEDDAMKALTLWPAEILGVDKQLGSLEAGKVANVIVTDGSPLALNTDVKHLVIAGHEVSLENKHLALYEKYKARPLPQRASNVQPAQAKTAP